MIAVAPAPQPPGIPAANLPMAEIERRLRWRFVPLVLFLVMMVGLGAAAALSLLTSRRTVTGAPDDRDARVAFALAREKIELGAGSLRFRSELTGEGVPGWPFTPAVAAAAEQVEALLSLAASRHPLDGRI